MRHQLRAALGTAVVAASLALTAAPALAAGNGDLASRKANFGPAIYADGRVFGTNGNGNLPAPTPATAHSYDELYVFTNGAGGQLAVAEAPPGPGYNGGRWNQQWVTWVDPGDAVVLTSEDAILAHLDAGDLTVTEAGVYFSCPLLPVKG
jgi:hypothetical protein